MDTESGLDRLRYGKGMVLKSILLPPYNCHAILLENLEKYIVWEDTKQAWYNTDEALKFVGNDYIGEKAYVASTI